MCSVWITANHLSSLTRVRAELNQYKLLEDHPPERIKHTLQLDFNFLISLKIKTITFSSRH